MSLRIIVRTDDPEMAVHVGGGSVLTTIKSFDVDIPEVEAFLAEDLGGYQQRQVIGVEVVSYGKAESNGI